MLIKSICVKVRATHCDKTGLNQSAKYQILRNKIRHYTFVDVH